MRGFVIALHPHLAKPFGINRALVLCQLHYLSTHPPRDAVIDTEQRVWIPRTYAQWQQTFMWMSASGVRKVFDVLRDLGLVEALAGEHENSYALTEDGFALFDDPATPITLKLPAEEVEFDSDTPDPLTLTDSPSLTMPSTPPTSADRQACPDGAGALYIDKDSLKNDSLTLPYEALLEAFCNVCDLNPKLKAHRSQVKRYVEDLWQAGYRAEDMACVRHYWQHDDYRTGRIYPKQVIEIIEAAIRKYRYLFTDDESTTSSEIQPEVAPPAKTAAPAISPATVEPISVQPLQNSPETAQTLPVAPQSALETLLPRLPAGFNPHWEYAKDCLATRVGITYHQWIADLKWVSLEGDVMTLQAQEHKRHYIAQNVAFIIAREFTRILRKPINQIVLISKESDTPVIWHNRPITSATCGDHRDYLPQANVG